MGFTLHIMEVRGNNQNEWLWEEFRFFPDVSLLFDLMAHLIHVEQDLSV